MYPTIIIDNFFKDPKHIVNFSKTIKWYKPKLNENWPGVRSDNLIIINKDLYKYILHNILNKFFGENYNVTIESVEMKFHKIKYEDWLNHSKKETRVHQDNSELAGIIYLNEGVCNEETGTTLYDNNKNSLIKISNSFNTLACYDGRRYHGATNLDKQERLTIVIFLNKIIL